MKDTHRSMTTARGVALLRAVEATRPEAQRLCADPYARSFIDPLTFHAMRLAVRLGILDITLPRGTIDFALARERYIHELMVAELGAGARQLVILGAGFDTRAYRIREAANLPVFEVDHPLTQAAKQKALQGAVASLPPHHRFVAVDFDHDLLSDRLAAAGYDERLRTLFVWQGVIMYLTPAGVDATLAFIAQHAAPGSLVVFDYFEREALSGPESAKVRRVLERMGEPLTFAIGRSEIVPFLEQRGFTAVANVDADELRRRVMTGPNAHRHVMAGAAIVSARVRG
jgi:methyltransferase (TIGR00027 family)